MTEQEQRAKVITEALSWSGTPYIPRGQVKGRNGGADCLTFLAGVFQAVGYLPRDFPIPHYAHDFHLHSDADYYLFGKDDTPGMLHFCHEIEGDPQPADIVLYKFGKCFAHAAIVIEWPKIIHAFSRRPVSPDNGLRTVLAKVHEIQGLENTPRPRRYFTVKDWGV